MGYTAEILELLSLSSRVGCNPLLVQASSGNTSIKLDGTLWIKASGRWLAHALDRPALVPVSLDALRRSNDFAGLGAWVEGDFLRASIETAMHAVLEQTVVIHVHSVNAIAWAVRLDGPERLAERLEGLPWSWIPYVASGLPLARSIERAVESQPNASIFVLANHGLVVCAETCEAAEELLETVEQRLAVPARVSPEFERFAGIDEMGRRVLQGGILYPCEAIFLGTDCEAMPDVFAERTFTATQKAVWSGLTQVLRRLDVTAPIRYLSDCEIAALLNEDSHQYQLCTEKNAASSSG